MIIYSSLPSASADDIYHDLIRTLNISTYCLLHLLQNVMMFWMLSILFLFLIIDVIILACWEGTDPLYRTLKQVRSQPEYKCFEVRHAKMLALTRQLLANEDSRIVRTQRHSGSKRDTSIQISGGVNKEGPKDGVE